MEYEKGATVALPHAESAERSILSTCIQESEDFIPQAIEAGISEETFYIPAHRVVWRTIEDLYKRDLPIELVSLTQQFKDADTLEYIGGASNLTTIYAFSPTACHFDHHVKMVKDKAFRRRVLDWTRKTTEIAYGDEDLTPQLAKPVEDLLESTATSTILTGKQAANQWLVEFAANIESGGKCDTIHECGIPTLDRVRGGIDGPGLTYVGALPSMGKTAFLLQMAAHKLVTTDERVLLFSLEMTAKQLMTRLLIHLCKFDDPGVFRGHTHPTKEELYRIREKAKLIASDRLLIEEGSGLDIAQIEARCKLESRKGGMGLIGVDYVQLVQAKGHDGVEQRMTAITHGLQRIMKSHKTSVVGLSQLTMDDGVAKLKYARSMEEDADLSIRLLGDEEEKLLTGIRITKDRHAGQVGWQGQARFNKLKQSFIEERFTA